MNKDYGFPQMWQIISEGNEGDYRIRHEAIDHEKAQMLRLGAEPGMAGVEPGRYCLLLHGNELVMNDTWFERYSSEVCLTKAHGTVIVVGLGIGMIPAALCLRDDIDLIQVVEIAPEVIKLVEPYIRHPKVQVIEGDFWHPEALGLVKADAIFLDIWNTGTDMNDWEPIKLMREEWRKHHALDPYTSWVEVWMQDYMEDFSRAAKELEKVKIKWDAIWRREAAR